MTSRVLPRAESSFGSGPFPRNRGWVIGLSVAAGFLLTVVWSAPLVDRVIGDNVASAILGHDARHTPIAGTLAGVVFAFVSGLAGTLTACNVAVFGAMGPLVGDGGRIRLRDTLKPVGWIAIGMVGVSAAYGAVVALFGTRMPQFSTTPSAGGLSPRHIQSMVAFGVIGLVFLLLGLIALGVLRDPFRRHPNAPLLVMGVLVGGFLVGRPYPMFRMMFRDAAERHDVAYGVMAFVLQSLGNVLVLALLFVLVARFTGARIGRWFAERPERVATVTGACLLVAGTFTLLYWDVRVLGRLDLIWYPTIPW